MTAHKPPVAPGAALLLSGVLALVSLYSLLLGAHVMRPVPVPVSQVDTPARRRALWAVERYCTPPQLPTPPPRLPPAAAKAAGAAQPPAQRLGAVRLKVSKGLLASLSSLAAGPGAQPPPARAPVVWQEMAGLIGQSARLYGLQQKAGPPMNYKSAMQHMVNMERGGSTGQPVALTPNITGWLHRMQSWKAGGPPSGGIPALRSPVPACHYLVDHQMGVIFIRTTKIGGTSITDLLGVHNHPVACRQDPSKCSHGCEGKPLCLKYMTKSEAVERVWQNYTVFAFVRNPWSRAISSFHFNNKRVVAERCRRPFTEFAEAPSAMAAVCLDNPDCCRERFGFVLEHVEQQSVCLFTAEGKPAVDFIGRSEHLEEDFRDALELINSRRPPWAAALKVDVVPRLNGAEGHGDTGGKQRAYAEHYLNNSALCAVRDYYSDDFELLRFPSW